MNEGAIDPDMVDGSRLSWIISFCLLLGAFYCAIAETAFSAVSKSRIKTLAEGGNTEAETALKVLEQFEKAITTLLICTNICHIAIASLVTVSVTRIWGMSAVSLSTILTTLTVFFAGEMLPKSLAKKYAEKMAMACAGSLWTLMTLLSPFSSLLSRIGTQAALRRGGEGELSVTEDELYDIIEDMTEEGTLDEEQGDLISSALQFGDLTVESVLTPRVDMVAIDMSRPLDEILEQIRSCNHSRLPVFDGTVDHIVGILPIREFIKKYLHDRDKLDLPALLDRPFFIHQSSSIDDALQEMTRNRQSIAIVTDNYGGTLGLVTIEDILEELVGDIWDEEDVVKEAVTKLGDGEFSVDADEHVSDVLEEIGFEDPEDNEELVNIVFGAWAFEHFTGIPEPGDSFLYHNLKVTVKTMDHNRIVRLILKILPAEPKEEGEA